MIRKSVLILLAGLVIISLAPNSWAVEAMGVDIHGFISQGYLQTTGNNFIADSKDGTFEFNEVGINFGKDLTDRLRLSLQFFAGDLGELGNNEIRLDYAYGDYLFKNWLGLRFGQMKAPHGLYNETRDIDMLRTSILMPQSVYQEVTRNVTLNLQGVGIYGHLDMKMLGGLSYQAMYGTQNIHQDSRMAEALVGYPSALYDNERISVDDKMAAGLVWATPLEGLRLGASYDKTKMNLLGRWNTGIPALDGNGNPIFDGGGNLVYAIQAGDPIWMEYKTFANWVFSMEYTWRNLMLMAEYVQTEKEFEISFLGEDQADPTGWYVGATYRFTDWFELGGYYSESQSDYEPSGILPVLPEYYDYLKDYCVTARFDINPYWVFKIEYHNMTGSNGLSARDNPASNIYGSDFFEKDWDMFAAKMTFSF